jgi:hypothetical protein
MRALLGLALLAFGCASAEPPPPVSPRPAVRSAVMDSDVRRMVLDLALDNACELLENSFLPLQDPRGPLGKVAGMEPVIGRWWVKRCRSRRAGDSLHVELGGIAWVWVNERRAGFRVSQYVLFEVGIEMSGELDLAYDPEARIATVWFTPSRASRARGRTTGNVDAEAETFGAGILDVVTLGYAGGVADDTAKKQADRELGKQTRAALLHGFTLTYSVGRRQRDVLLQTLARGEKPERPFPDDVPWALNEVWAIHAWDFSAQVAGPFRFQGPVRLDVRVEDGSHPAFRVACFEGVKSWIDPIAQGKTPEHKGGTRVRTKEDTLELAVPDCSSWYLIAEAPEGSRFALRLHEKAFP